MYLKHKQSGDLVEVLDQRALVDPCQKTMVGRYHAGEELQEPDTFHKLDLQFPSGEQLPLCWVDPNYPR